MPTCGGGTEVFMKKFISCLLIAGMILSSHSVIFAENSATAVLSSVKDKVEIPAELTEFKTSVSNNSNGNISYNFLWNDKEYEDNISVSADSSGRISSYHKYISDWYKSDNAMKISENFSISELETLADSALKTIAPQCFDYNDTFLRLPYDDFFKIDTQSTYTFNYARFRNNTEVKDNYASVSLIGLGDGKWEISAINIEWDYDTAFAEPETLITNEEAQEILSEKYPVKLKYRSPSDGKYLLEYVREASGYIDAQTGEDITEDSLKNKNEYLSKDMSSESLSGGSSGGGNSLSAEELKELNKISELKSANELMDILKSMPELKVSPAGDDISSYFYKQGESYIATIYFTENYENETEHVHVLFNAKTGELLSFSRYNSARNATSDENYSPDAAKAFLNKYYENIINDTIEKDNKNSVYRTRLVNGIEYINNYIEASADANGRINSFSISWDDDISDIPAADNIISDSEASASILEKYPVSLKYIQVNNIFTLAYKFTDSDSRINAFTGKFINYSGDETNDETFVDYSDTDNHWIHQIAEKLASYGIGFKSSELYPDKEITQSEFLKLVYSGVLGRSADINTENLYSRLISRSVLSKDEMNSDAPLSREKAAKYLLRAMGITEAAELTGIYICDFADSNDISPELFGYAAIAKGFNILKGTDGYLYPRKNITRAEALAMIYNYLTR